jgi:hypothetical protein
MHVAALALAALAVPASAAIVRDRDNDAANEHNPYRQLLKRGITDDAQEVNGKAFDFVIAGGGVAGLAIAARLSEWKNVTVCVIEAGSDGSDVRDNIDVPGKHIRRAERWPRSTTDRPLGSLSGPMSNSQVSVTASRSTPSPAATGSTPRPPRAT